MSDENKIHILRKDKPPIDEMTGLPQDVVTLLDEETLGILDQTREMIVSGDINSICLVAFNDQDATEMRIISARVWAKTTRAIGLIEMLKQEITTQVLNSEIYSDIEYDED